ncbi:sugar transferase [Balneolales bacterium ANBcel1]|nr:sugar transferase [Balneolales bacterium ANBcel1]
MDNTITIDRRVTDTPLDIGRKKEISYTGCREADLFIEEATWVRGEVFFLLRESSNHAASHLAVNDSPGVICHQKINNVRYLNKFFETVNESLNIGDKFIGCVETNHQFRSRIKKNYPFFIVQPYLFLHFLVKRVLPKWSVSKRLYFFITRGRGRMLSLTEVLGRLVSCGFVIDSYRHINGLTWFSVTKKSTPLYDMDPTYGPLVRLKRTGRNGKIIKMYKFRTMHPYAEYLQEYIVNKNGLDKGDKIRDDYRVTSWGKIMRKFWIDELPMFLNFFKGDLKLFGVRPLSSHKLSLYSPDFQKMRNRHKPGLIPPFYVDLPDSFEGLEESEHRYLVQYEQSPWKTDFVYFWKALYNIFIKRARSA